VKRKIYIYREKESLKSSFHGFVVVVVVVVVVFGMHPTNFTTCVP
jgi:hypothetical protein